MKRQLHRTVHEDMSTHDSDKKRQDIGQSIGRAAMKEQIHWIVH